MSRRYRFNSQSSQERIDECVVAIESYTKDVISAEKVGGENENAERKIDYYLDVIKQVIYSKMKGKR